MYFFLYSVKVASVTWFVLPAFHHKVIKRFGCSFGGRHFVSYNYKLKWLDISIAPLQCIVIRWENSSYTVLQKRNKHSLSILSNKIMSFTQHFIKISVCVPLVPSWKFSDPHIFCQNAKFCKCVVTYLLLICSLAQR